MALGVLAFMLLTRVLSPQYLVWVCAPLVGLAERRPGRRALWTLGVAAVLSQVIFPFRYQQLQDLAGFDVALLATRNLLLVAVCALTVRALAQGQDPEPEAAPPAAVPEGGPAAT
jgi:hypothetical protein